MNKILRFTWDEWKWLAIIIMLGIVMYWTALVIQPTYDILRESNETQKSIQERSEQAVEQNELLIENQNNNTEKIEQLIRQHRNIEDAQIAIITEIGNTTAFLRSNFNETFLKEELKEKKTTLDMLGNITDIRDILLLQKIHPNETLIESIIEKEMREFVQNMRQNLTNN